MQEQTAGVVVHTGNPVEVDMLAGQRVDRQTHIGIEGEDLRHPHIDGQV